MSGSARKVGESKLDLRHDHCADVGVGTAFGKRLFSRGSQALCKFPLEVVRARRRLTPITPQPRCTVALTCRIEQVPCASIDKVALRRQRPLKILRVLSWIAPIGNHDGLPSASSPEAKL